MKPAARLFQWFFYITAAFLIGATVLRTLLLYRNDPLLSRGLGLLLLWLGLFASEGLISRKWRAYFPVYLLLQTLLISILLYMPVSPDYFAVLFAILCMQIMSRYTPRQGVLWIGLFTPLMAYPLVKIYTTPEAIAFALIYTGINALMGSYTWATQRAQRIQAENQSLAQELGETNRQLQNFSEQLERLAIERERNHMARELHDSVTQTIFSMTLTTQSALLLLERNPGQVGFQLERLDLLARQALSEMRTLVSKLRPQQVLEGGLAPALRQHLASRQLSENLTVTLEIQGDQSLQPAEEGGLFRIVQEALNNIVKHAQVSQAQIRLHLSEPFWIEIEDQGLGFDLLEAQNSPGDGLTNMRERAAEIGWSLSVITSPGRGTRIRVEKMAEGERRV